MGVSQCRRRFRSTSSGAEVGRGPLSAGVDILSNDGTTDRRPKYSLSAGFRGTRSAIDKILIEQIGETKYDEAVLDTGV